MHETETRRPCHHEPRGLTDADCCRCIMAAGADALATCRACRRGQALARTTWLGIVRALPQALPVPGMRALEVRRVTAEDTPKPRRPKRQATKRTASDARQVRASTAMAMTSAGGNGRRRGNPMAVTTGPAMADPGGMGDTDDLPVTEASLPLDDGDWQAPWEELVMPEPEALDSEEAMKEKLEEAEERELARTQEADPETDPGADAREAA